MSLSGKQQVFAYNFALLLMFIKREGYGCSLGEVWRTPEMAILYAKKGMGIVDSQHCKKLAADINLFKDGVYLPNSSSHTIFGQYWETLHPDNRWGGDWNGNDKVDPGDDDGCHYEMRG
jgi:hypothetical protein